MKRLTLILILMAILLVGCQRGDIKLSPVIQGQPAPHDGFNLGPEIYVYQGQPCKMSGMVLWVNGLDPNTIGQ